MLRSNWKRGTVETLWHLATEDPQ